MRLKQIELPGNLKYTIKLGLDLIIVMHNTESSYIINSPQVGKSSIINNIKQYSIYNSNYFWNIQHFFSLQEHHTMIGLY